MVGLKDQMLNHSFISDATVDKLSLDTVAGIPFVVGLSNGNKGNGTREIYNFPIRLGKSGMVGGLPSDTLRAGGCHFRDELDGQV